MAKVDSFSFSIKIIFKIPGTQTETPAVKHGRTTTLDSKTAQDTMAQDAVGIGLPIPDRF